MSARLYKLAFVALGRGSRPPWCSSPREEGGPVGGIPDGQGAHHIEAGLLCPDGQHERGGMVVAGRRHAGILGSPAPELGRVPRVQPGGVLEGGERAGE